MNSLRTIAVTGSRGFLGHNLIRALKEKNFKVIEIDIKLGIDILSREDLDKIPPFEILVHLAANTFVPDSYNDSFNFYQTNIMGTINCLEICKKYEADMIFASSYVYGKPKYLPVDENHTTNSWNPYATSKLIGEQLCTSYSVDFGLNSFILRVFNIFGPGQDDRFLLPTIIKGLKSGKLQLQCSSPKRDFVYVLDVVDAIVLCATSGQKGTNIYNVGSGVSYSVKEVVDLVRGILNVDVRVDYKNSYRKNEVANVIADISKIRKLLKWYPRFDLEAGLRHYLKCNL